MILQISKILLKAIRRKYLRKCQRAITEGSPLEESKIEILCYTICAIAR